LLLRINDAVGELDENRDGYQVRIEQPQPTKDDPF
jgi:hypothetical protein